MQMRNRKKLSRAILSGLISGIGLFTMLVLPRPMASIAQRQQPAFEGRPITPAGRLVLDATTRQPAVGALPVAFVRSPDHTGPDGGGRYLISVNSGYGMQFGASTNKAQQSLAVIDLNAKPEPVVIQNVYFPTPQSVNVGVAFSPKPEDGAYALYASGGFENKVWVFRFVVGAPVPISPASSGPATSVTARSIDVSGFAPAANTERYNDNREPVYPAGLAIGADGDSLFIANNLADNLGIVRNVRGGRELKTIDLRGAGSAQFIYPYGVVIAREKVYVSCWGDGSVCVVDSRKPDGVLARIAVERHPTSMTVNRAGTRLYVVNSDADSVSVIDTGSDREIERISVRLSEKSLIGGSPESLDLSPDEATLYVANAHSNAIAVVALSPSKGAEKEKEDKEERRSEMRSGWSEANGRSRIKGFIPTGQYPSAVAAIGRTIFIGNGKGSGVENSSVIANDSGRAPNMPNDRFPRGSGRGDRGGQYSVSLISGTISAVAEPDDRQLATYTQQVMRNDGLIGQPRDRLFRGESPIKHVIYIIKENRTYDQLFGDVAASGDGTKADGEPSLAIFGSGEAARRPGGTAQDITPNQRALALRFGLMDRFFVNAAASPEGHNWSTAAFSSDYTDKAYRWSYSSRGRPYDFEGFNRMPEWRVIRDQPSMFSTPIGADDLLTFLKRYVPYLHGARDVAEPETLYLWDAAQRAGLSYRIYGEFVATVSQDNVDAINRNRQRGYPDVSPSVRSLATKKSLEGHFSPTFRSFDLRSVDAITPESYRQAVDSNWSFDPMISNRHRDERFRGTSRLGEWLEEFEGFVKDLEAGRPDRMPNFSMVRLGNDHTMGLAADFPTPQFYVAENDYAVGRLVEAVSNSPYWKDTAIFVVEDDAQDGPDHVDCHRAPALVISAYNKPGALIHEFHSTVSLIRTMEILIGMQPMNQLDATASPIDIFRETADLRPFKALMPQIASDNLTTPASAAREPTHGYWMRRTADQNLSFPDLADARVMNEIIWFSVRGAGSRMPQIAWLPVVDAMRESYHDMGESDEDERAPGKSRLARR